MCAKEFVFLLPSTITMKRESKSVRIVKIIGLICLGGLVFKLSASAFRGNSMPNVRTVAPAETTVEQFTVEIRVKNKGIMRAVIHPEWAPLGADRFRTLGEFNKILIGIGRDLPRV